MWPFIPRVIEKFLDLANLQRHNDNYNDIKSALEDLAGTGRTNQTIKATSDTVANHLADKANPHGVTAAQVGAYTKTELQTSGQSMVHWDNLTNKPNFADARWGAPVATKAALDAIVATQDGEVRLVLEDETVYEWDAEITDANKWRAIGAIGNGLTSHSALTNLNNDDHPQYLKTDGTRALTGDQDFAQHQAKNLVIHSAPTAPENPAEGQPWYDSTNHALMIYKGSVQGWVDISGKGAVIRDEEFTALAGQTVFDITVGQYEVNTNAITFYKKNAEGKYELVPEEDYTETSPTRITLNSPAVGGEEFYVKFFENSPEIINQSVKRDGTLQTNLNSEFLNGHSDSYFAPQEQLDAQKAETNSRHAENIGYGVQSGLNVLASGTPDRNVHIQTGVAYLPDGSRKVYSTVTDIQLQAADATNPRKDMIYIDKTFGGIMYASGVASATPVEPSLPADGIKLCVIDVPAGDNAIDQAQITDSRVLIPTLAGVKQSVDAHLADYASKVNQGVRTTDKPTFAGATVNGQTKVIHNDNDNYSLTVQNGGGTAKGLQIRSGAAGPTNIPFSIQRVDGSNILFVDGNGAIISYFDTLIKRSTDADRVVIAGASAASSANGAHLVLQGKDYGGANAGGNVDLVPAAGKKVRYYDGSNYYDIHHDRNAFIRSTTKTGFQSNAGGLVQEIQLDTDSSEYFCLTLIVAATTSDQHAYQQWAITKALNSNSVRVVKVAEQVSDTGGTWIRPPNVTWGGVNGKVQIGQVASNSSSGVEYFHFTLIGTGSFGSFNPYFI
ncbi:hypothetical protein [Paenibacillus thermotolerans]|uniref:hypothetical protein n=1 Tax=Paenibacillus thermotolerans TaxID=3027807 RepID=UPI00236791FA|nr:MULTISPECIES: hypothetical protein [unclassified Paenibacillus]